VAKYEVWGTGVPIGVRGQSPGFMGSGERSPPGAEALLRHCTTVFASALTNFIGLVLLTQLKTLIVTDD